MGYIIAIKSLKNFISSGAFVSTYEIIYFNKGTDELKKESKANICAMNELCDRYYYSNLYNEAFDLANEISLKEDNNSLKPSLSFLKKLGSTRISPVPFSITQKECLCLPISISTKTIKTILSKYNAMCLSPQHLNHKTWCKIRIQRLI